MNSENQQNRQMPGQQQQQQQPVAAQTGQRNYRDGFENYWANLVLQISPINSILVIPARQWIQWDDLIRHQAEQRLT